MNEAPNGASSPLVCEPVLHAGTSVSKERALFDVLRHCYSLAPTRGGNLWGTLGRVLAVTADIHSLIAAGEAQLVGTLPRFSIFATAEGDTIHPHVCLAVKERGGTINYHVIRTTNTWKNMFHCERRKTRA